MKLSRLSRTILRGLLAGGALCIAFSLTTSGQVQTKTKTTPTEAPTKQITVERGEIVYVSGNSVVVKMEDGTLRHFDNVPESATVTVDGKQLNVHQLQPGMKVERQIITTSTPKMITTVKTVTGTVWHVSPPNSVILTRRTARTNSSRSPKARNSPSTDK